MLSRIRPLDSQHQQHTARTEISQFLLQQNSEVMLDVLARGDDQSRESTLIWEDAAAAALYCPRFGGCVSMRSLMQYCVFCTASAQASHHYTTDSLCCEAEVSSVPSSAHLILQCLI
jgi:hypothetical protein